MDDMKICLLNKAKSFLFHLFYELITLFNFSPAGKKRVYFPFLSFKKTRVSCYKLCEENKSIKVTNVGVEKIKLSPLLVQRINEFKMNEIQRKTPQ